MKWLNHQCVTGVIVYVATEDLLLTAFGMAGAILPDRVEGNPRGRLSGLGWRSRHRGWSHWPMLYIALIGLLTKLQGASSLPDFFVNHAPLAAGYPPSYFGIALCAGALLHIAEDAVCGKVPFLTPNRKVGIRLFTVGSFTEYFFSLGVVLLCYAVHAWFR